MISNYLQNTGPLTKKELIVERLFAEDEEIV